MPCSNILVRQKDDFMLHGTMIEIWSQVMVLDTCTGIKEAFCYDYLNKVCSFIYFYNSLFNSTCFSS